MARTPTVTESYESLAARFAQGDKSVANELARLERASVAATIATQRLEAAVRFEVAAKAEAKRLAAVQARLDEEAKRHKAEGDMGTAMVRLKADLDRAAATMAEFLDLGVVARNVSFHEKVMEEIRASVFRAVPVPFRDRLLTRLGGQPDAEHRNPLHDRSAV
jgi:hypothetical protein